jgi:hypothetical protein
LYGKVNENQESDTDFFVHKRIISAVKRVEYVSDRMSYIILRGSWCHIIVLNVHAPTEDITDDVKDNFNEELQRVFDKFPKYHINVLLGHIDAKIGREDIYKPTNENEISHEISIDDGVRLVNFAISKNRTVKAPHSRIATSINIIARLQLGNPIIRLTKF